MRCFWPVRYEAAIRCFFFFSCCDDKLNSFGIWSAGRSTQAISWQHFGLYFHYCLTFYWQNAKLIISLDLSRSSPCWWYFMWNLTLLCCDPRKENFLFLIRTKGNSFFSSKSFSLYETFPVVVITPFYLCGHDWNASRLQLTQGLGSDQKLDYISTKVIPHKITTSPGNIQHCCKTSCSVTELLLPNRWGSLIAIFRHHNAIDFSRQTFHFDHCDPWLATNFLGLLPVWG